MDYVSSSDGEDEVQQPLQETAAPLSGQQLIDASRRKRL